MLLKYLFLLACVGAELIIEDEDNNTIEKDSNAFYVHTGGEVSENDKDEIKIKRALENSEDFKKRQHDAELREKKKRNKTELELLQEEYNTLIEKRRALEIEENIFNKKFREYKLSQQPKIPNYRRRFF